MSGVSRALTFPGQPLYNHNIAVERAAEGIPVMVDQTSAAALMNLVGMSVLGGVFIVSLWLWLWLGDEDKRVQLAANPAGNPAHHRAVI